MLRTVGLITFPPCTASPVSNTYTARQYNWGDPTNWYSPSHDSIFDTADSDRIPCWTDEVVFNEVSTYLFFCLFVCSSVRLSVCAFVCLCVTRLSVSSFVCLFVCSFVSLLVSLLLYFYLVTEVTIL